MKFRHHDLLVVMVGIVAVVTLVFLITPLIDQNKGFDFDGVFYGAMAGEKQFEANAHKAPWCYRILTPYLASLLPWSVLDNFRFLAFVSNIFSLTFLYLILRSLNFSQRVSVISLFLYGGVFWTLRFSFYDPVYIDYQTQLLLLVIVYLTIRRLFFLLVPVFVLAAFQKESLGLFSFFSLMALAAPYRENPSILLSFRHIAYALALPVLSLGIPLLLKRYIHSEGYLMLTDESGKLLPLTALDTLRYEIIRLATPARFPILIEVLFSGLGLIPVLLGVHYKPWIDFLKQKPEWMVYAFLSLACFFCGIDKSRLLLYLLPLATILAANVISTFQGFQSGQGVFQGWLAAFLTGHLFVGGYLTSMGSYRAYMGRMVPEHTPAELFLPYLFLNTTIGALVFFLTIGLVMRQWRFAPSVGFVPQKGR